MTQDITEVEISDDLEIDIEKTLRNKREKAVTEEMRKLRPQVLAKTGERNEQTLHAAYGSKHRDYTELTNTIFTTPEQFFHAYLAGYLKALLDLNPRYMTQQQAYKRFKVIQDNPVVLAYLKLLMERTFLREFIKISTKRPANEEAEIWFGPKNASYGLLLRPRFKKGQWENEKVHIRKIEFNHWSIEHILSTGLVIPGKEEPITFDSVDHYLSFFKSTLVSACNSNYQDEIAQAYCNFVKNSSDPVKVPLLIPEHRYEGLKKSPQHRLDFCIIDAYSLIKVGFASATGDLLGLEEQSSRTINKLAKSNAEEEPLKPIDYFRKHNITALIYTDEQLTKLQTIFQEIAGFLNPETTESQLQLKVMEQFYSFGKT